MTFLPGLIVNYRLDGLNKELDPWLVPISLIHQID